MQNGSARRPPWHPNFKRTKNRRHTWGRYMQLSGISYGERLLPRKKFTTLWFPPASKGRKLHGNSGWEFSYCAFSHKGEEPILQKQVEYFHINRANKWVRASQSLTGSKRGRSSARTTPDIEVCHNAATDSAPAKHCPCYAWSTPQRDFSSGLLLRATDTSLSTQRYLLRDPPPRRSNTTATLIQRPSRQLSFGSVSTD